jgi:hypothetical protein
MCSGLLYRGLTCLSCYVACGCFANRIPLLISHSYEENAEQTCEAEVTAAHQGKTAFCPVSMTLGMLFLPLFANIFCIFSLALHVLFVLAGRQTVVCLYCVALCGAACAALSASFTNFRRALLPGTSYVVVAATIVAYCDP